MKRGSYATEERLEEECFAIRARLQEKNEARLKVWRQTGTQLTNAVPVDLIEKPACPPPPERVHYVHRKSTRYPPHSPTLMHKSSYSSPRVHACDQCKTTSAQRYVPTLKWKHAKPPPPRSYSLASCGHSVPIAKPPPPLILGQFSSRMAGVLWLRRNAVVTSDGDSPDSPVSDASSQ